MDLLISLAENKFIQSNHRVFKSFAINQSESSINYKVMEFQINFMSNNQNGVLLLMGFSTILTSFVDIKDFFTGSICGSHQSE